MSNLINEDNMPRVEYSNTMPVAKVNYYSIVISCIAALSLLLSCISLYIIYNEPNRVTTIINSPDNYYITKCEVLKYTSDPVYGWMISSLLFEQGQVVLAKTVLKVVVKQLSNSSSSWLWQINLQQQIANIETLLKKEYSLSKMKWWERIGIQTYPKHDNAWYRSIIVSQRSFPDDHQLYRKDFEAIMKQYQVILELTEELGE